MKKLPLKTNSAALAQAAGPKRRDRNSTIAGLIFLYTPRNRNRGGTPSRGGIEIWEPPLQRAPTSGTLALEMSSLERASFGGKRNFC